MLRILGIYLIGANILSFFLMLYDHWLVKYFDKHVKPTWAIHILTMYGGALGTNLAYIALKQKANKDNMKDRLWAGGFLILQAIIVFVLYGPFSDDMFFIIKTQYHKHIFIVWYLILINIVTFVVYGLDKLLALAEQRRLPIRGLILFAFVGGTVGGICAMYLFHHKIKKKYFTYGLPILLACQIYALIYFAMHS